MSKNARKINYLDTLSSHAAAKGEVSMESSNKPNVRERMEAKLSAAFAPEFLKVIDESLEHAGHAGGAGHGGETHFRVHMISSQFSGRSRVDRHRAVNDVLAEEIAGGVHALALDIKAPGE